MTELLEKCTKKTLEGIERMRNRTKGKQIERNRGTLLNWGKDKKQESKYNCTL